MQTNIELAGASGRAIRLPVAARRERQCVVQRPARPVSLFTLVKEVNRSERWENVVWIGIAIATLVLLVMSFGFGMRAFQKTQEAARWGAKAGSADRALTLSFGGHGVGGVDGWR